MKLGFLAVVLLALTIVAGCGTVSRSGTIYEYNGKKWLVIRETKFHQADYESSNFTSTERLAIIRPDGTAQFVAIRTNQHTGAYKVVRNQSIAPAIRKQLGEDPILKIDTLGTPIRTIGQGDLKETSNGGFQIKTSLLQDNDVEDHSRAPAEIPNDTENISLTKTDQNEYGGD